MTFIATKRLTLRPSSRSDVVVRKMIEWLNDNHLMQYSEQRHYRHTPVSQFTYIGKNIITFREIYHGKEFIGTINAENDTNNDVANVGILIGKDFQGNGFGCEAWTAYCDALLNNGTRKIEAGAMSINRPMIKIFEKSGMTYEGRREAHFMFQKEEVDMVLWRKFRD